MLTAKNWSKWTLFFAFWTLAGFSFASQFYLSSSKAGLPVTWTQAVSFSLGDWYVYAVLSIAVVWIGRRFPFTRGQWQRAALLHILASIVFSFGYIILRAAVGTVQAWAAGSPITFSQAASPLLVKTFQYNLWVYWVILAVWHAFDFYQQLHERELRASELESRLARARLQALQSQLNPHFLFNTLHTISALMHKDVDAADRMIMKLGDLLRMALKNTDVHEVPLRQELDFLSRYLEIEKTRFRERLSVETQIDPTVLEASVPNLVLQPLVENAIRHGIEPHARPGKIILRAQAVDGRLCLEVRDNGGGIDPDKPRREGVGLSNTRTRLQQLYGPRQNFELQNAASGGLLARVTIPLNTAPSHDPEGSHVNSR